MGSVAEDFMGRSSVSMEGGKRLGDRRDDFLACEDLPPLPGDGLHPVKCTSQLSIDRPGRIRIVAEIDGE